ncbi:hypothetical protein PR048_012265 [Dryococelus australis]|uniref:Uncharacterized protein n=1 Tax=Dryococelus australis TaxID=614101 RepID=A0ABQ9HPI7_9NEOP|nr:hypothetical protein PR048_012265 [Dryococelus australis]
MPYSCRNPRWLQEDRILQQQNSAVKGFIMQLKGLESHYSKSKITLIYLDSYLSIVKMWGIYQASVSDDLKVKDSLFRKVFVTNFNGSSKSTSTDICSNVLRTKVFPATKTGNPLANSSYHLTSRRTYLYHGCQIKCLITRDSYIVIIDLVELCASEQCFIKLNRDNWLPPCIMNYKVKHSLVLLKCAYHPPCRRWLPRAEQEHHNIDNVSFVDVPYCSKHQLNGNSFPCHWTRIPADCRKIKKNGNSFWETWDSKITGTALELVDWKAEASSCVNGSAGLHFKISQIQKIIETKKSSTSISVSGKHSYNLRLRSIYQ